MKVLFVALLCVAGVFGRSAVQQQNNFAEGPKCPIDDPLIRPGPVAINVTLDPIVNLLEGSEITNLVAEGLSTLKYTVNINAILLSATFDLTVERVTGNATYTATGGYIDARPIRQETIPSGNVTGSGFGKLSATGVHAKGRAALFINLIGNRVSVRTLNLETVSFDSLEVDLGTSITIGGETPNWAELSANIKANFDTDFAEHKNAITEKVRVAANTIVGRYTLAELIDLINNGSGPCDED